MDQKKPTRGRLGVAFVVLMVSIVMFADRNLFPVIASPLMKTMDISPAMIGWLFSTFSIVYVVCQIPGGLLLDKLGSRVTITSCFVGLGVINLFQGLATTFDGVLVVIGLFIFRALVAFMETPAIPSFTRVITTWFPLREKGLAITATGSSQYIAAVGFVPFFAWYAGAINYQSLFVLVGILEIIAAFVFYRVSLPPAQHPWVNNAELDYIREGGALVDIDKKQPESKKKKTSGNSKQVKAFLTHRITIGVFLSQYCFNCLSFFFLSWFPMYLMTERGIDIKATGLLVAIPAFCAFLGSILAGASSDFLMRKTNSLNIARKMPIIVGMICSFSIIFCNYVDSIYLVIAFMSLSYFGKGCSTLGWVILSDVAPKEIIGSAGGIFNALGNVSTIVTPIVIGYIVTLTGSFTWALIFVSAHAVLALFSYIVIVGPLKRIEAASSEEEEQALVEQPAVSSK
ncbi:MFS transporter [Vibrio tritonius]|uniref:MFS transporter n=1 Tax=Vibrio tritonius TaxID=1435069 RepID=UPI000837B140|nr:MFS transporter [Vibrio tritonius]